MEPLLEIKQLSVSINTVHGKVHALRNLDLTLNRGEILAVVGESGCGKSMLCKAIMGLLPPGTSVDRGTILVQGMDVTGMLRKRENTLCGTLFSMVLQNPMTALDPTLPVGVQIGEAVFLHHRTWEPSRIRSQVLELMALTGIREPSEKYGLYPHQLSGGMRQRCVLAAALACRPQILLADEPTTALDVTVQSQILNLLRQIQEKLRTATILVTHDLGVVAGVADRVAIMYAGKIVEIGTTEEIYYDPRHPYTWGLLLSHPYFSKDRKELYSIPGMPPSLLHPPKGDAFACRNPYALAIDYEQEPPLFSVSDTHSAATWLLHPSAPQISRPIGGANYD